MRSTLSVAAGVLGLAACAREAPRAAILELLDFHQDGATGVFLNEPLVLHFSGALDRSSVTRASVAVLDANGRQVAGSLAVDGARVTFTPELPRRPDLNDGGFLPGAEVRVAVAGFPFPDGVRGRDGEPLLASRRFAFRVVELHGGSDETAFAPPLVEMPTYLSVATPQIGPVDPIVLTAGQALDPRRVTDAAFELLDGATALPLRVQLVENGPDGARIELRVLAEGRDHLRALERGSYFLREQPDASSLCTLGGIPVQPAWLASRLGAARIAVFPQAREQRLEFDAPRIWTMPAGLSAQDVAAALAEDGMWSPVPLPGVDGTAYWGDGEVAIRYPAAAGTGADGAVLLEALDGERIRDVHATRLTLSPAATVELPPEGLLVLRSQGAMHLAGALRRKRASTPPPPMVFPAQDTLSAWLARARADDHAWTVVIAGGDLYVDQMSPGDAGGIDLAGPLLLVAGGRLRIFDSVKADDVQRLAPGGEGLAWAVDWSQPPEQRFRVDAPVENPLVEPLRFGVQSLTFQPATGVTAWRPNRIGAWSGSGEARVRWIGLRFSAKGSEEYGPLDDVMLLAGSDALRFTIELVMPAAGSGETEERRKQTGRWDPPRVDYVEFRWDAPLPGEPGDR
jgi:hypothetical protein